jgi:hypothetical protein
LALPRSPQVASGYEGPRFLESDPYKGYSPADWHSTWLYFKDLTFEQTNTLYRLYFNVLSQVRAGEGRTRGGGGTGAQRGGNTWCERGGAWW